MAKHTDANSLDELRKLIQTLPVVDNHAHNILRPHQLRSASHDFLTITTEAHGEALEDAPKSLAHLRAVKQLRKLYNLPADADWASILGKRIELLERDPDELMGRCLKATQTILIDDGLDTGANVESYSWHDKYTLSPCKRIVRIETVAADILSNLQQQGRLPIGVAVADEEACNIAWVAFVSAFEQAIVSALSDDEVVGFKSVICYRTGLDITVGRDIDVTEDGLRSFRRHYLPECLSRNFRVEAKGMNDALVISACKLIAAGHTQTGVAKPLQFHTGLGDNDISLLDSNPACLQELIKAFPTVPVVLLHSAWPYTREAAYLATVYKNVYLDIGEVFPMVSRDGQEQIVRQALELAPTSKLLWSTDGHYFPETYWLANVQGRAALEKVFCEYVAEDDMTVQEACEAVKNVLFRNSNELYGLKLKQPVESSGEGQDAESKGGLEQSQLPSTSTISDTPDQANVISKYTAKHPGLVSIQYVVVQWLDYLGLLRSRILPIVAFRSLMSTGGRIGISKGNLGTLQNDHMTPVCDPVGQIMVEPDLLSMKPMYGGSTGTLPLPCATVMARFVDDEDFRPLPLCPRSQLAGFVSTSKAEYDMELLVGFEIEVTFMGGKTEHLEPLDTNHAWGTLSDEQLTKAFSLITSMATALMDIGIEIQQLHSEAGAGQYEFVLPPLPPVEAVDTLVQARQCIQQMAASHGLRATFHPMPFPGIGTAAHAHISLNSRAKTADELKGLEMSFMASVLAHLPALCAFTMPQRVSYGRVVDDGWTGGTWVAWGTQNREVPLRRVGATKGGSGSRWEVRCLDGMANMYLALGAIFGAGLAGVKKKAEMNMKDCTVNPSKLSDEEKRDLGITQRLPTSIDQATETLEADGELVIALNPGLVAHYVAMKKAEQEMLGEMAEDERRIWFIERY